MNILEICIWVSSLSFLGYVASYFTSPHMKSEFVRFGLEKFGLLTILLQIAGSVGLLIGLIYNPILVISSLGLALLMLLGFIVRIKIKDSVLASSPALFYMILNAFIFLESVK